MTTARTKKYFETQVKTASREQLLLMLFDGGIRFARMGKENLRNGDYPRAFELLRKSQRIVMEILCALDKSIAPDIYANLTSLYKFIYLRLAQASLHRSETHVDEAIEIFDHLRQTWTMAMEKDHKKVGSENTPPMYMQQPCVLSIQG